MSQKAAIIVHHGSSFIDRPTLKQIGQTQN